MTFGARLQTACKTIGWSANALATRVGCYPRLVQKWWSKDQTYEPPEEVTKWAERIARFIKQNPPPGDWKRRKDGDNS